MVQMLRRLLKNFGKPAGEPPRRNRLDAMLEGARQPWLAELPKSSLAPLPLLYRHAIRHELADGASAHGLDEAGFDRFADAWCALLAENARLPESLQIPEASIHMPRNLLLAYFGDQSGLAREAQTMLRYVESQFGAGGYAQVEILLRLFETEAITQRNNERNIFFERCNKKLLSARPKSTPPRVEPWQAALSDSLKRPGAGLPAALAALADHAGARFHLLSQDMRQVELWTTAAARLPAEQRAEFLQTVPGWRFRSVDDLGAAELTGHLVGMTLFTGTENHLRQLVMACYFVALATGRTGQEPLIAETLRWLRGSVAPEANRILSEMHRRCSVNDEGLVDATNLVLREFIPDGALQSAFTETEIRDACATVHRRLAQVQLAHLPEGEYDLGGIILDELLGFRRADMTDQLKLHRLV